MNKIGATNWTMGKLLTIVLAIVFLVLVIYGVSSGGLNPLIERAGGMFDQVLLLFGMEDRDVDLGDDCGAPYRVDIAGVGSGLVTECLGECNINFDNAIPDVGKDILLDISRTPFTLRSDMGNILENKIVNLAEIGEKREVYFLLRDTFYTAIRGVETSGVPLAEDNSDEIKDLMGQWNDMLYLKVVRRGDLELKYQMRSSGGGDWYKLEGGEWVKKSWSDSEGLQEIYFESLDAMFSKDNEVYWRVGEYDEYYDAYQSLEGAELDSSTLGGNNDYQMIPGMVGQIGAIDDDDDYGAFFSWFVFKEFELEGNRDKRVEGSRELIEKFRSPSINFGGENLPMLIGFESGRPIVYIDSFPQYGLLYGGGVLRLIETGGTGAWELSKDMVQIASGEERWQETIKINKIYDFLEGKC